MPESAIDKTALRRHLRKQRRSLSIYQQHRAASRLSRNLSAMLPAHCRHIGVYYPADGEISPLHFCQVFSAAHTQTAQRNCYLPMMLPGSRLQFCRYRPPEGLVKRAFGIREVSRPQLRHARKMDAVLLPLVGFDAKGNRLGMGGGFYDRTFAFKRSRPWRRMPLLIGVAHHVQQVTQLHADNWDVPLDFVVTDQKVIRCKR